MTDGDALLLSILRDPAEDTPRLAYADWLEEHAEPVACGGGCFALGSRRVVRHPEPRRGSSAVVICPACGGTGSVYPDRDRAAFIRLQCELARMPGCDPVCSHECGHRADCVLGGRGDELRRRERELWSAHCHEWLGVPQLSKGGLMAWDDRAKFRRGFVSAVTVPTLAVLLGGVCERCEDDRSLSARSYTGPASNTPGCPDCSGTGRVGGIARELFTRQPVETVAVANMRPADTSSGWSWCRLVGLDDSDAVPPDVFDRLPDLDAVPSMAGGRLTYPSRPAAQQALSAALVAIGRGRAGLPPLPGNSH